MAIRLQLGEIPTYTARKICLVMNESIVHGIADLQPGERRAQACNRSSGANLPRMHPSRAHPSGSAAGRLQLWAPHGQNIAWM